MIAQLELHSRHTPKLSLETPAEQVRHLGEERFSVATKARLQSYGERAGAVDREIVVVANVQ
jgi:hypothetical protein